MYIILQTRLEYACVDWKTLLQAYYVSFYLSTTKGFPSYGVMFTYADSLLSFEFGPAT